MQLPRKAILKFVTFSFKMCATKIPRTMKEIHLFTMLLMKAILKAKTITFPFGMDDASEDIIGKLLQFDVRKRLGCGSKGVGTVKKQAYFKSINFNELRAFKIEAPFIPEADISKNFDVPEEDEMAAAEPWVDDGTGWADEF